MSRCDGFNPAAVCHKCQTSIVNVSDQLGEIQRECCGGIKSFLYKVQNKPSMQYMHLSGFKWHSACWSGQHERSSIQCLLCLSVSLSLSLASLGIIGVAASVSVSSQLTDSVCVCVCVCLSVCLCATYYPHQQLFHVFYGGVARTLLGRDIWAQRDPVHTMYHTI